MNYRGEIDGLRAIAVLSVIFYHAEFVLWGKDWFQGGYIGVDVFFVISGYLITRIILNELTETKKFDFINFYERRARRILPVLFAVMLASLPLAWFRLLPEDFVEYSYSIISAVFFASNFFFYFATTEYGADSSLLKPFLHTWSLGVEEQFYIFFPLLLVFFNKAFKKHLLVLLLSIAVLSLFITVVMVKTNSSLNFFLPFSRIWELLAGSILAYIELKYGRAKKNSYTLIFPLIGLAFIILSVLFFNSETSHPSFVTLIPITGTALLIAYTTTNAMIGKILSSIPLKRIGLLSYSLYLWHFPIFAFGRMKAGVPSNYDKIEWIIITFALSLLSFHMVENRFRLKSFIPFKTFLAVVVSAGMIILMVNSFVLFYSGFPNRLPKVIIETTTQIGYRGLKLNNQKCHTNVNLACEFLLNDKAEVNLILIGDSHADTLAINLLSKLRKKDIHKFVHMTISGCPLIIGFGRQRKSYCTHKVQLRRIKILEKLGQNKKNIIVYFARTPVYLTGKRFDGGRGNKELGGNFEHDVIGNRYDNFKHTLDSLSKNNVLFLVYPMPEMGLHVLKYLNSLFVSGGVRAVSKALNDHKVFVDFEVFKKRMVSSFRLYDSIEIPNEQRFYPHQLFCNNIVQGKCVVNDKDDLFYVDYNHPSYKAADTINNQIIKGIDRVLSTPR